MLNTRGVNPGSAVVLDRVKFATFSGDQFLTNIVREYTSYRKVE